jgi:sigma-B regulation protein RsbU (phosphoserine phosphatase)
MNRRLQLLLIGLFFALLFVYAGARVHSTIQTVSTISDLGWAARRVGQRIQITRVSREGFEAGLHVGDVIVAINGQPSTIDTEGVEPLIPRIPPESNYTLTVQRDGRTLTFSLLAQSLPLSIITLRYGANVLLPTIFLLTGFAVFLLKPFDKQAVLLSLMFGMFIGGVPAIVASFAGVQLWLALVMLGVHLASLFLWPVFVHFFLIFPERSPILQRYPNIEYFVYLPQLLTILPYFGILNVLGVFAPQFEYGFRQTFLPIGVVSSVLFVAYIAGGIILLLMNYRQASRPARRRMRVVVAGSIAGFAPIFAWLGLSFLFDISSRSPGLSRWFFFAAIFAFPLFPLAFAYAIVRHQVIPIRLILSRSARYLFVSRGFIIVQAVVVFGILSFLLTGSRMAAIDRLGERADIVATMIATGLAIALLTWVNQRVMPLIDRRFFREAYDAQQLLSDLSQEMRRVTTVEQLLELAVAKIQDALHTENVTIFLRHRTTGDYTCAISSQMTEDTPTSSSPDRTLSLPATGYVVSRLSQSPLPLTVDLQGPKWLVQWAGAADAALKQSREHDRSVLRQAGSVLLLPVATKDELLGIVSLGPRLGDLPFSREDKQLLMTVAWQMAFAIQNALLIEQATEEERLRHELDIATAVQRRLFPECPPEVERLELAGLCHPAGGVGGDYYDFIMLDAGKVGIAVADVAGKGISAALLMSTVQASLRSHAPSVNGRLTELVSSMNRLLHMSTDASSYATFFYAQFDHETCFLSYVNAGHNPPILLRAGAARTPEGKSTPSGATGEAAALVRETELDAQIEGMCALTVGGPIIGIFQSCVYEQETIEMNTGDLLVAYTDGVTEAINPDEEEFGEARLQRVIAASAHLSANEISDRIVESVREWRQDKPLHDDLTLVVMKVK